MSALAISPRDMVRSAVTEARQRGLKAHVAFEDTASVFGRSARWVKAVYHGEPSLIAPRHAPALAARFIAWMEADIARCEQRTDQRRAALAAVRDAAAGQGALPLVVGKVG